MGQLHGAMGIAKLITGHSENLQIPEPLERQIRRILNRMIKR